MTDNLSNPAVTTKGVMRVLMWAGVLILSWAESQVYPTYAAWLAGVAMGLWFGWAMEGR